MFQQSQASGAGGAAARGQARRGAAGWPMLLIFTLAGSIGAAAWFSGWSFFKRDAGYANLVTTPVLKGRFTHEVVERGELESSNNVDVRCEVKSKAGGSTAATILWIALPGTKVQPGDKLIEFDSSSLKADETQQTIATEQARANLTQGQLLVETARIAVNEYLEGTFQQELQTVEAEIVVAEETLRRAQDYHRYSEKLSLKGYVTAVQLEADLFAVRNAELALAAAKTKKKVLVEFTKPKMVKTLESAVASNEALMHAQKAALNLEEKKLNDVRDQIKKCLVYAPAAGQVVYHNEGDRRGNPELVIAEGVSVRERQIVIRLPDPSRMQVKAKIKEGRISLVHAGQRALIRTDAVKDRPLHGKVTIVDPIALPSGFSSIKEYAAVVEILDPPSDLMPTMSAEVSILVNEIADCLHVPVQAVVERNGQSYVCLPTKDGLSAVMVQTGANNDQFVEIKSGLREGDQIALNADHYLKDLLPPEQPNAKSRAAADAEAGEKGKQLSPGARPAPGADGPVAQAGPGGAPGAGGSGQRPSTPAESMARFDKDGDGKVSVDELPGPLQERFSQLDRNSDGFLDLGELAGLRGGRRPGGPPREGSGPGAGVAGS